MVVSCSIEEELQLRHCRTLKTEQVKPSSVLSIGQ